jgi:hypothetical protein
VRASIGDTVHLHYSDRTTAYTLARVTARIGPWLLVDRIGDFKTKTVRVHESVVKHINQLYCDSSETKWDDYD